MRAITVALLVLSALAGTLVVLSRDPRRQVFALAANGIVLSILFEVLQAPDVALSEIVVNAAVLPLMFLAALGSIAMDRKR